MCLIESEIKLQLKFHFLRLFSCIYNFTKQNKKKVSLIDTFKDDYETLDCKYNCPKSNFKKAAIWHQKQRQQKQK